MYHISFISARKISFFYIVFLLTRVRASIYDFLQKKSSEAPGPNPESSSHASHCARQPQPCGYRPGLQRILFHPAWFGLNRVFRSSGHYNIPFLVDQKAPWCPSFPEQCKNSYHFPSRFQLNSIFKYTSKNCHEKETAPVQLLAFSLAYSRNMEYNGYICKFLSS